jgi:streptogramin lyase
MSMRACLLAAVLALVGCGLVSRTAFAQDGVTAVHVETRTATIQNNSSLFVQFGIAGKPTNLAIENTGRAWVTLPELNAIGVVSVTATTSGTVNAYLARTYYLAPGSQPYDLTYHDGKIWFTAFGGNYVGELDIATDNVQMHPIPGADSGPTGIAVAVDGTIWFAQRTANSLGQFNPISSTFQTYAYPLQNGDLEEVATVQANSIWFTAPAINRIANFNPATVRFTNIPTLPYTLPRGLAVEPGDDPWVSVVGGNAIGRYSPGTLALWRWTNLPVDDASALGAQRIALTQGLRRGIYFMLTRQRRTSGVSISPRTRPRGASASCPRRRPPVRRWTLRSMTTTTPGSPAALPTPLYNGAVRFRWKGSCRC